MILDFLLQTVTLSNVQLSTMNACHYSVEERGALAMPVKIFLSYSHRDESLRDELEKHLAPLKRSAIIETWHDRRISAGQEFDKSISEYLESADIILMLISADFLNSDYCYDREMGRALERHDAGEARVIPVILHACDQNEAFLDIVSAIRQAATEMSAVRGMSTEHLTVPTDAAVSPRFGAQPQAATRSRSSNLRVRKSFTDRERDRFERDAFEYMANFFETSLMELSTRNAEVEIDFQRIDATRFTSAAYINGQIKSEMTVWLASHMGFNGIAYHRSRSTQNTAMNGIFSVEDDGHMLFLTPSISMRSHERRNLSFEGAAEFLWEEFMEPLQRGY
jgi:hypothetical protein